MINENKRISGRDERKISHPIQQIKYNKVEFVETHSSISNEIIKPSCSVTNTHYGVIVHGNVYAITKNGSVGGLIGDNFTTDDAADKTGSVAFTMEELFLSIEPSAEDLVKELKKRIHKMYQSKFGDGYVKNSDFDKAINTINIIIDNFK